MNKSKYILISLLIAIAVGVGSWGLYILLGGASGEVNAPVVTNIKRNANANIVVNADESQSVSIDLSEVSWETFHGLRVPIPDGFSIEEKSDAELTISSDRDDPKTFSTFFFVLPGKQHPLHIEESEYTKIISSETHTINGITWDYQLNTTDLGIDDVSWTTGVTDSKVVYFYHNYIDSDVYRAILNEVQKD